MKKDLLTTGGARIIVMVVSLLQGIIVARCLLDEGKGIISLYLVALNLTLALGDMGGKQSYAYFMAKRGMAPRKTWKYIRFSLALAIVLEFVLLSGVLLSRGMTDRRMIVGALMGIMTVKLYNSFSYSYALASRKIRLLNVCNVVAQVTTLAFVALFIGWLGKGEEWYFFGSLIGVSLVAIILSWWRVQHFAESSISSNREAFDWSLWREITAKGFSYAIPLFIMGLNYRLDVFIIEYFRDEGTVGIYSQGASLAQMLWLLPEVLALVIFSHSLNSVKEKKFANDLLRNLGKMMLAMGVLLAPIGLAAYYLIPIVYGPSFEESSWVFVVILPGVYLMILFKSLNGDLAARGFPRIAGYVFLPAVVLNVVLNILFIPNYGAVGAALASCISYSLAALVFFFVYRRMTAQLAD
ncbi:MAG: polysaccharide biosynthesis C-terminal domain-containing protein [Lewinella sp.]